MMRFFALIDQLLIWKVVERYVSRHVLGHVKALPIERGVIIFFCVVLELPLIVSNGKIEENCKCHATNDDRKKNQIKS